MTYRERGRRPFLKDCFHLVFWGSPNRVNGAGFFYCKKKYFALSIAQMKKAHYLCGMKITFKSIYDETPPTGQTLLLYDKGAFYTGKCVMLYGNPHFIELPGMFYPTHWDVLPEGFDLQTLTQDDEPDGWTNAYYQKRGQP